MGNLARQFGFFHEIKQLSLICVHKETICILELAKIYEQGRTISVSLSHTHTQPPALHPTP